MHNEEWLQLFHSFKTLYRTRRMDGFKSWKSLIIWISAAVLFFVLRKERPDLLKVQKISWRWFGIGILAGIGKALLLGYPMALQIDAGLDNPSLFNVLLPVFSLFLYQLGMAAVAEEPLFRGFLRGHLRKAD